MPEINIDLAEIATGIPIYSRCVLCNLQFELLDESKPYDSPNGPVCEGCMKLIVNEWITRFYPP